MFKAKFIENHSYYRLRSKQLLLMLLPSIPFGLIVNFHQIPTWCTILMIVLYIFTTILLVKNQKQINLIFGNKWIEIDVDQIRIKSKNGALQETIKLIEVQRIILKKEYTMPQDNIKEISQNLTSKTKENYLILHLAGKKRQLNFEIDSYYMIKQLDKLTESWVEKGYKIERVN